MVHLTILKCYHHFVVHLLILTSLSQRHFYKDSSRCFLRSAHLVGSADHLQYPWFLGNDCHYNHLHYLCEKAAQDTEERGGATP